MGALPLRTDSGSCYFFCYAVLLKCVFELMVTGIKISAKTSQKIFSHKCRAVAYIMLLITCMFCFAKKIGNGKIGFPLTVILIFNPFVLSTSKKENVMISRETANMILEEFSRNQGLDPIQLDNDGYCVLASADGHVIHIRFDGKIGTLAVFGTVGTLSDDVETSLIQMRALLSADFMWEDTQGATAALVPDSNTVLIQQLWLPEQATAQKFDVFLQDFARLQDFFTQYFQTFGNERAETEETFYVKV